MSKRKLYSAGKLTRAQQEIRELAMADLKAFVALVAPTRLLGHCHKQMLDFFSRNDSLHQLTLWPRAHQKSAMMAFWTLWHVVNKPDTTVLYASDSTRLAESQLSFIKTIMESDIFRRYWPELIEPDEGRRSMWRNNAVQVDHWLRKENLIRDPTIFACGQGTGITGAHFDVIVLDDIVVYDNSATKEERSKCETWFSLVSSILNPGGMIKAVGTRYHPDDLYQKFIDMTEDIFDSETGEVVDKVKVWSISQRVVEVDDQFLWPRQRRDSDGAWFGFNKTELSKKKAQYINKLQFYAQYYNNPNDPSNVPISNFRYYDKSHIRVSNGNCFLTVEGNSKEKKLNVFASIDFASTLSEKSDYTAIAVVGIDCDYNIYILDLVRLKTDKISKMQEELTKLYMKWNWLKLRGEATGAQNLVVEQIKEFNKKMGLFYNIEIFKPISQKELRIMTNLEPRYEAGTIYHYEGGNCELLEEELMSKRPPHDDLKDALASVMEILIAPVRFARQTMQQELPINSRFGGIAWQ